MRNPETYRPHRRDRARASLHANRFPWREGLARYINGPRPSWRDTWPKFILTPPTHRKPRKSRKTLLP